MLQISHWDDDTTARSCSFRTYRSVNLQSLWMIWKEWPCSGNDNVLEKGQGQIGMNSDELSQSEHGFPALQMCGWGAFPRKLSGNLGAQVERDDQNISKYLNWPAMDVHPQCGRVVGHQLSSASKVSISSVSELLGAFAGGPTMW